MTTPGSLELAEIQGNTLKGYGNSWPVARWWPFRMQDAGRARELLGQLDVTSSVEIPRGSDTFNLALSGSGLRALGVSDAHLGRFPQEFRAGMAARARSLRDPARTGWDSPWNNGEVHGIASFYASDKDQLGRAIEVFLNKRHQVGGLDLLDPQDCARRPAGGQLPTTAEHFGFTDGLSQPDVEGIAGTRASRRGKRAPGRINRFRRHWEPLKAGEFVLGYQNETGEIPPVQLNNDDDDAGFREFYDFARNGTFLVYRKLQQYVGRFRDYLVEEPSRSGMPADYLAARMLGRWRDGTPLSLVPGPQSPTEGHGAGLIKDNASELNDFTFADDPAGTVCPIGSHIRRANPREGLGFHGDTVNRHRILRRGIPYGTFLAEDDPEDHADRGLAFVAINASIAGQFEVIQRDWINDGDILLLGTAVDPITGHTDDPEDRLLVLPGRPPEPLRVCASIPNFVEMKGGEYFFVPSISAIQRLALGFS